MPVIDLIPHRMAYLISQGGYEDVNGDWHQEYEEWSDFIPCHAVESGSANLISYSDGSTAKYSYTIGRLPVKIKDFSIGERIKLDIFGKIEEHTVKGFHRYQLQSKLWV